MLALGIAAMAALSLPSMAVPSGTFEFCGYTVEIVPDDPECPGISGTIKVDGSSEYAEVHLEGTYVTDMTNTPPTLTVQVWGTIATPDATYDVDKTFVFEPKTRRQVWKTIVAWIESIIAC